MWFAHGISMLTWLLKGDKDGKKKSNLVHTTRNMGNHFGA